MSLEYKKMSLFDAPERSIIVHACNAKGSWNAGIAAEFKNRYPYALKDYEGFCQEDRYSIVGHSGSSMWHISEPHHVWWLITSSGYGSERDSKEQIKINTTLALYHMCRRVNEHRKWTETKEGDIIEVYSNKFNSGLFQVPWEETELILLTILKRFSKINWIVCEV